MARKQGWHRWLAHKIGYDIDKFNKQVIVETHLRELLPRLHADVVLDVGANIGQYAEMLRYVGYRGRIISFEPGQAAFARLQEAAAQDDLWQVYNLALGDSPGTAVLNVSNSSVFSSLHQTSDFGKEKYGGSMDAATTEEVKIERLDSFLNEHLPDFEHKKVFLKMDTQGHDRAVFEGAGDYAGAFCGIQSEIAVTPIYEDIPDYMESLAMYRSYGYEVTGLYTVNRHRATGHVIEFDCVMAPRPS